MSGATTGLPVSPEGGGGFSSYRRERIAASHTEPGLIDVLGTAFRTEHGVSFLLLFFHTLRLGPTQPNLLRNMSRRRRYPCERRAPFPATTKRCHPIKETAPGKSYSAQNLLASSCRQPRPFLSLSRPSRSACAIGKGKAGANSSRRSQYSRYGRIWKPNEDFVLQGV